MPNAISSASPCHVMIGHVAYDVIVWTIAADGVPTPWINRNGSRLESFYDWAIHSAGGELYTGTAAEHVQGSR